jgi:signal transduction histidine kinase/CheY-like chemotaxis protein
MSPLPKNKSLKQTDLKLLVTHKLCVSIDATVDEVEALSKESNASYFSVVDDNLPIGLVARVDKIEEPKKSTTGSKRKTRLLHKLKRLKIEMTPKAKGVQAPLNVRDIMLRDPLIIEYGIEPDILFEAVFDRTDDRFNEDIILTNEDGTYFGNIRSNAVMRLLNGFLGKHMRELRKQRETLAFQHNQVVKVRRDLELTNEKLEFSRDQAMEGVRMKSQFLANMSHEIRTPMNGVFGMIDLLYDTPLDDDQESLVTTARSSAETLMRIINDILDFSKIEAGKMSIETMPFNIVEIVESSAALYAETATEKELNLSVNFEDVQPWVKGDPHRYQQILNNLISNALKFTDTGEVEVYLTPVETDSGLGILTEVRDTGMGITPSHLKKLFQPFTQADGSDQRKHGGTGLGLSISKTLIDLLNGTIDCESEEEKGTVFSFVLPFPPHMEEGASTPANSISQKMQCNVAGSSKRMDFDGMRALLVEDNLVNQEVARRMLVKLNCKVTCAENGRIALEYLANGKFDCVFMDCQMPVMNGYDSTRQIRQGTAGEENRNIFISAVTAHVMTNEREKCYSSGMNHYFAKPFGLKDFRQALDLASTQAEGDTNTVYFESPKIPNQDTAAVGEN